MSAVCRRYSPDLGQSRQAPLCTRCGRGPDAHLCAGPAVVHLGEPLEAVTGAPAVLVARPAGLSPLALVWRERIVAGLAELGFHGFVLVPEHRPGAVAPPGRAEWRAAARQAAGVALYWLAGRSARMSVLLAFDADARSGKAVLGIAPGAAGAGFVAAVAKHHGAPVFAGDLRALLVEAVVRAEAAKLK